MILRRTPEMMATLSQVTGQLEDPDSLNSVQPIYAQSAGRSDQTHEELLIMLSVCTHLGCSPTEKLAIGPAQVCRNHFCHDAVRAEHDTE